MATKKPVSKMAKIVTVFNQKGGCGKTMTTMQVGGAIALKGYKTLVVDMDPQGTAAIWHSQAKAENPFPADVRSLAPLRERMVNELSKLASEFDVIMIDCPPAIESSIPWSALLIADIAVIPVIPVMDNFWATREARALAMRAKEQNSALRTFYVASCVRRGALFKALLREMGTDDDVPLLSASLTMRNAYPESQLTGSTVHAQPKAGPAIEEVDALAEEILSLLGV